MMVPKLCPLRQLIYPAASRTGSRAGKNIDAILHVLVTDTTCSALKETPLAIAKIRDALNDIGVPPRLIGSPSSVIQLTSLADDHKSWVMWLRGKKGDEFAVRWDAKMFPNGVIIGTEQEGWAGVEYKEDGQTIHIKVNDAAHEKQALLRLTAK